MKRQRIISVAGSVLLVCAFAFMSIASSSTKNNDTPAQDNGGGAGTNVTTQGNGGNADSTTTTAAPAKKASFEITSSSVTVKKNSLKENTYFAVVEITNTGETFLAIGGGQLDFVDNDKSYLMSTGEYSLFSYSAPDLIGPNEKGYIFAYGSVDEGTSIKNGVNIDPQSVACYVVDDSKAGYYDCEVSSAKVKKDSLGYVYLSAKVTNNSEVEQSLNIYGLLFNKKGKVIGGVEDLLVTLEPGGSKGVELKDLYIHTFVNKKDVDHFVIFARATDANFNYSSNRGEKIKATPASETTETSETEQSQ